MKNIFKTFFQPPIWLIKKILLVATWILMWPLKALGDVFSFKQARTSSALFVIAVLAILAGLLNYPKYFNVGADRLNEWFPKVQKVKFVNDWNIPDFWNIPFRLGLDLQGGTHLVYDADLNNIHGDKNQSDAMTGLRDVIERRVNLYGVGEPLVQVNKSPSGQYRLVIELAGVKSIKDAIKMIGETPYLEFRTVAADYSTTEPTQLTGKYLKNSNLSFDPNTRQPLVDLEFDDEGSKLFEQLTEQNIGKPLAIYLDGAPISAPRVNEKISGGKAVISGQFTIQEAREMVQRLNSGALPVPIKLVSQQSIESSLGRSALDKSLIAGLYAFLAVAIFMVLWYRVPGVLAVLALIIYTVLTLALFKLLGVTLTLAGIAGFILSIGMAVDANILIFARMREEFRSGRTFGQSIDEGFKRAWTSIRDSNFTTLLTCLILYYFTTSVVRGFAFTLAIGVLVSMFSAIFVTRIFLKAFAGTWVERFNWLWYR